MTERGGREQEHRDQELDETVADVHALSAAMDSVESTESMEYDESAEMPDLSAIQADDALLDALRDSDPAVVGGLGDQELNALLLAWQRDIDSELPGELVGTSTAVSTIKAAELAKRKGERGRRRILVPIATAAAVLAIGFTGTALGARDAQPGDTLWGVSKVLYSDYARSIEAAAVVRTELQEAQLAITQHRYSDARMSLSQAKRSLQQVTVEDELSQLTARHTELMDRLETPADPNQQNTQLSSTTATSSSSEIGSSSTTPTSSPQESSPDATETPTSSATSTPESSETTTSTSTSSEPERSTDSSTESPSA